MEVALRTAAAPDAIQLIRQAVPGMIVGAGSIRCPDDWELAVQAGAQFSVSPGATSALITASKQWDLPFLPGAATASEMMQLAESGFHVQKFFPAAEVGGIAALQALSGPLPEIQFCPSGGVNASNCSAFLALTNVIAVSGSWIAPPTLIAARDWRQITDLARQAMASTENSRA